MNLLKYFIRVILLVISFNYFSSNTIAQSLYDFKITADEDTINVNYNLVGNRLDDVFKVGLLVSGNNGQTFNLIPRSLTGDIGYGIKSGLDKQIKWQPLEDSIQLVGNNFIFKISAKLLGATDSIEMITIPAGSFMMGNSFEEGRIDENNLHRVNVDSFQIGVYEITNTQFAKFLAKYGSDQVKSGEFIGKPLIFEHEYGLKNFTEDTDKVRGWRPQKGYEYHPVVNVTWFGANEFCKYYGFRLPTEAEWEYASRELGNKIRFGNGKNFASPTEINFDGSIDFMTKYSEAGENRQCSIRIASFSPNKLELFDMSGNVWEWCQDWYSKDYYLNSPSDNPTGPWLGDVKSIRGGSWYNKPLDIRVTDRSFLSPVIGNGDVGFRVVKQLRK